MSYIDNTLLVDEHVLYRSYVHWMVCATTILWVACAAVFLLLSPSNLTKMGYLFAAAAVYDGLLSYIRYISSEYAVTNKRVLGKTGLIQRNSVELFLQKVEGIQIHQSLGGRLFNYGTIMITGTGGSKDQFCTISDPIEFRRRVQEQIEKVLNHPGV